MLTTWWSTFTGSLNILWAVLAETWRLVAISWELLPSACQARMRALLSSLILACALGLSAFFFPFWHTSTQPQHSLNNKNITLPLDMHLMVLFWLLYNHSASFSINHRLPHHPQPFAILEKKFAVLEKKTPTHPTPKSHFLRPIRDFRKKTPTTQDLVFRLFTAFAIYEKSSQ